MSLSELQSLVTGATTPGPHQAAALASLGTFLHEDKLSQLLRDLAVSGPAEHAALVRELVSVPDRTVNMLGLEPRLLPDWVFPATYCGLLLRSLARAARSLDTAHQDSADTAVLASLLQQLHAVMPDYVASCDTWWRYVVTCPRALRGLLARVGASTRAAALARVLRYTCCPDTLRQLFRDAVTEAEVLQLLLRGAAWCGPDQVWCLVSLLSMSRPQAAAPLVVKVVTVWSDELEVDQGQYHYLSILCWLLCSALGRVPPRDREEVRHTVTRRLMAGMTAWLEADPGKRQLGMVAATAVLEALGGPVPEWGLEDTEALATMRSLVQGDRKVETVRYHVDLDTWEVVGESANPRKEKTNVPQKQTAPVKVKPKVEVLDSDDSDDDDDELPAYDMSEDTPYDKDKKPLLYVRDVIDQFVDPESGQQEEGLARVAELARLQHEDPAVVRELLAATLHLHNKFESAEWAGLRQTALTSVIVAAPLTSAGYLTQRVFDKEVTLDTKFLVVDSLVAGAGQLRDQSSAHLGRYLELSVSGLCEGGGGAWARVKVAGLETALLTHTLVGVSSLAQLGRHTPSHPRQLATAAQLMVAVAAGSGHKRPVQAAVLHGLGVLATQLEPRLLVGGAGAGQLPELVARAAEWAGQLRGDLAEAGRATGEVLRAAHGEMARLQLESELAASTEIKMRVSTPEVNIKSTNKSLLL